MRTFLDTILSREPVAVLAAIEAILGVIVVLGFDITAEQSVAILGAAGSILALVARNSVSPVDA